MEVSRDAWQQVTNEVKTFLRTLIDLAKQVAPRLWEEARSQADSPPANDGG
jgi:hypothetical protein